MNKFLLETKKCFILSTFFQIQIGYLEVMYHRK